MKLPRDLSGRDLVGMLGRFGYEVLRQDGSHIRLVSHYRGSPHHLTIPDHSELKVGTLRAILRLVAEYLEITVAELQQELFG